MPSYVVYDTTVSYDMGKLDPSLRGLQASVNVQNIFDREYYSSISNSTSYGGDTYGTPRNMMLTAKYSF